MPTTFTVTLTSPFVWSRSPCSSQPQRLDGRVAPLVAGEPGVRAARADDLETRELVVLVERDAVGGAAGVADEHRAVGRLQLAAEALHRELVRVRAALLAGDDHVRVLACRRVDDRGTGSRVRERVAIGEGRLHHLLGVVAGLADPAVEDDAAGEVDRLAGAAEVGVRSCVVGDAVMERGLAAPGGRDSPDRKDERAQDERDRCSKALHVSSLRRMATRADGRSSDEACLRRQALDRRQGFPYPACSQRRATPKRPAALRAGRRAPPAPAGGRRATAVARASGRSGARSPRPSSG